MRRFRPNLLLDATSDGWLEDQWCGRVVRIGDVSWEEIAAKLATLPFVEKVQAVSGDIDIILTVSAPDHEQLSQAILRDIHDMHGVVSTRSHLILAELDGRPPAQSLDIWRS